MMDFFRVLITPVPKVFLVDKSGKMTIRLVAHPEQVAWVSLTHFQEGFTKTASISEIPLVQSLNHLNFGRDCNVSQISKSFGQSYLKLHATVTVENTVQYRITSILTLIFFICGNVLFR